MSYYITVKQNPAYKQMSLEDFLMGNNIGNVLLNSNETSTKTYKREEISSYFKYSGNAVVLAKKLYEFNKAFGYLREKEPHSLYREFYIPKKSGGLRKIDAPNAELMAALHALKSIIEESVSEFILNGSNGASCALYHTSAYAYIKKRSCLEAMKRHQQNESKWFEKLDLSKFFNNTTVEYVMRMMRCIFPFCLLDFDYSIYNNTSGKWESVNSFNELEKALSLAFLDGGLPQGTPISPLITNIIMIPVDYELNKALRDFENQSFVYTRYADDFTISSKYNFNPKEIEALVVNTLKSFNAPFTLNKEKTRYGSANGSNWNLGIMLNKDNNLTVGHKRKKEFQNMLFAYAKDKQNGIQWDLSDVQTMEGYRNYYRMIEGNVIDSIINYVSLKAGVDVLRLIKNDLRAGMSHK